MTAPVSSVTLPLRVEVCACARVPKARRIRTRRRKRIFLISMIPEPQNQRSLALQGESLAILPRSRTAGPGIAIPLAKPAEHFVPLGDRPRAAKTSKLRGGLLLQSKLTARPRLRQRLPIDPDSTAKGPSPPRSSPEAPHPEWAQ